MEPVKFGWSVLEWSAATGLGRTLTYAKIKTKEIETAKVGDRRIILTHPVDFLRRFAVTGEAA